MEGLIVLLCVTNYAIALIAIFGVVDVANCAGLAAGGHFSVIAPTDEYAQSVRDNAESFRQEFSREWLGAVPVSDVRTVISVHFSTDNEGCTLAREKPSQRFHNVFITASPELAGGPMLCHEVAHTVLATAYPYRLPVWVEEGIACRYDCEEWRRERAGQVITARVSELLDAKEVDYTAAESIVSYLLTKGDKQTLLAFADAGQRHGWGEALSKYYRIADVAELQRGWREWLAETR